MKTKITFSTCSLISLISLTSYADNNTTVSLGYTQYSLDYFADGDSRIKPDGGNISVSHTFNDNWYTALSYSNYEGEGAWPLSVGTDLINRAETESSSTSLTLSWLQDDFDVTFSYGRLDNEEFSLTRLPAIIEGIKGEDDVFSLSFNQYSGSGDWLFGWGIGTQYADSSTLTRQLIAGDPVTIIDSRFDSTNWSAFIDLDLSYWIESDSFSWAPQFTLSWDWEVTSSGEPLFAVTREGQRRIVTQFNDQATQTFRRPDTGFWEAGVYFDWNENFSSSIGYGQSIDYDEDLRSISLDVSFSF